MANKNPLKYDIPKTYRVDDEFVGAVEELRAMHRPIPPASDIVRRAVLEMRDRERKKAARK